jgi:orotidine-5'-phosphate decarboxylase
VSQIGYKFNALESAVGLANIAVANGARAIVCSPLEIEAIRKSVGAEISIITPGVRPQISAGGDDQNRTLTPSQAIKKGANLVVIGRPITSSYSQGINALRERAIEIAEEILK